MQETPVVALQGPRSVGKSTLLAEIARRLGATVINLDDRLIRNAVASDPAAFVTGPSVVCVDEFQRVPDILDAIKVELDDDLRWGRFLLTGSTRFDALPRAAQSLTGRIQFVSILPFSQGELGGVHEDYLATALNEPAALATGLGATTERLEYAERICAGGMPIAVATSPTARARWFDTYINLSLQRDAAEISNIRRGAVLPRLLERLAGQTGQILNIRSAGRDVGLETATADAYVKLLEDLFLVQRLPAWGRTLRARAAATPKIHVVDSGLAARLLRLTPARLARLDPATLVDFGHLLETFVVGELLKQASWSDDVAGVGHWRTHDGQEVDLVIEGFDGRITCFEIKASRQVDAHDARGLVALRNTLGDQFNAGFVLGTGDVSYKLDDRIFVTPIDRLWQPAAAPAGAVAKRRTS